MAQLARTGYDDDLTDKDRRRGPAGDAVHEGLAVRSGGLAKLKRGATPAAVWTVGIFAFLIGARPRCCSALTRPRCRISS